VTEIPEHLLARSKARRQAIGQDQGGDAEAATPSTAVEKAAPASAAPAGPAGVEGLAPAKAPAPPAPAPPPPKRPEVVAAETRKKIPWWAATALVALPLWAFLFAYTLEPPTAGLSPALSAGEEIYGTACGTCHGPAGEGGTGPAFAEGAVVETFSNYEDHVSWVTLGSARWTQEVGSTYGDPGKPVLGFNGNPMPSFEDSLSEEEILEVVRYEREIVSGFGCEPALAEATGEECAPGTEAEAAAP
jgi:mono/diheme cytochrome c family protein